MPIKGLTNQLRMPRIDKIHLGVRSTSQSGSEYPTPTDYFVCPQNVINALGDPQPRELTIMFPTDEPEQFADAHLKLFSRTRGLVCKGDGEWADRTVNMRAVLRPHGVLTGIPNTPEAWPVVDRDAKPEDIGRHKIECRAEQCPQYGPRGCRRMMMLQFLLPDVPGLGIYQIDTGSRNSILNIYGGIELVRAIVGRVAMVPLKLQIGPMETTSPETGRKQTNYVMSLHCDLTMTALSHYKALGPGPDMSSRQLPDPDDEVPTDLMPDGEDDLSSQNEEQEAPAAVSAPPRPTPTPMPPAEEPKPAPTNGYGSDVWSLTVAEMRKCLSVKRNETGVSQEALAKKAAEMGLGAGTAIKPDQFMALMDWMAEGQEATHAPAHAPAEAKNRLMAIMAQNHISIGLLQSTMRRYSMGDTLDTITDQHMADLIRWAEGFTDSEHGAESQPEEPAQDAGTEDAPQQSLQEALDGISDEITWDRTLELASQYLGIRTLGKLETEVLKMSRDEWIKLGGENAAATAARRVIRAATQRQEASGG